MNTYEFTFLATETEATTKLEKALESFKGKKLDETSWGKRLLAYPINKKTDAHYFTWYIHLEHSSVAEFKKKLQYDKIVLRYLLMEKDYTQKNVKKVLAKGQSFSGRKKVDTKK